ncbi:MAG: flippase [Patescibacteria group bacterium]|nr:flippase [Patescibacteria group bacterium]
MLNKKIAYNSIISSGARIIGLALSLVIIGFVTRYLGRDGFGYYSVILAFLFFFTVLADLGLYSICLRDISRPNADENKIINNSFTLRFFAGLFIFSLAPIVVYFFPYTNEVKLGVLIGSFGFWMMSNHQVLMGVFQKYLRMDRVAIAELAGRLFQLILILFFIWQKLSFLFIVSAFVGGALINFVLVFIFIRKYIRISFEFDFIFWRSLLRESLPLALAIIFTVIYFKLDTIMLSLMKPPADVGIYNLSYKFLESLLFFPAMFIGLVMPLMSRYALSFRDKFKKIIQESLDILLLFIVPLIIGTFFLSKKIVVLIAGDDFLLSAGVLNLLIIAGGIIFLGVLFSNMIISLKEQKKLTYIYGIGAIINLIANFIFIPKYSYYGAAGTTILTEFIVTVLMLIILHRMLKSLPSFHSIFKYVLAGLVMAVSLYYLHNLSLFILIILSGLIYFGFLYLINGLPFKNIMNLIKK